MFHFIGRYCRWKQDHYCSVMCHFIGRWQMLVRRDPAVTVFGGNLERDGWRQFNQKDIYTFLRRRQYLQASVKTKLINYPKKRTLSISSEPPWLGKQRWLCLVSQPRLGERWESRTNKTAVWFPRVIISVYSVTCEIMDYSIFECEIQLLNWTLYQILFQVLYVPVHACYILKSLIALVIIYF